MKRLVLALFVLSMAVVTAWAVGGIPTSTPAPTAPAAGKLVVHEWGTFTGFAGSDGAHLPFRSDVGGDLPGFVLTRSEQHHRLNPADAAALFDFSKDGLVAMQRMETPVVYLYADAPRDVDVKVDFPQGLLTEFYPPVRVMAPPYRSSRDKLSDSSLDWGRIRILPGETGTHVPPVEPNALPAIANNTHYQHARATDAALVRFSDKPGEVHEEKFLFYRGVGNFTLPVALAATGEDRFVLQVSGDDPIAAAFLVRIEDGQTRFASYQNIRGRLEMNFSSEASSGGSLGEAVVKALVGQGLYEKEARAMVKTWESSWFAEKGTGTRLLYTVPRRVTDAILPLKVTPTPDETVRVLVGRIDVLTPEQEAKLAAMMPRAGAAGAINRQEASEARALGRFLRPALDRAATVQADKLLNAVYRATE